MGNNLRSKDRNRPLFPILCPVFPCAAMRHHERQGNKKGPKLLICLGLLTPTEAS
jgi:hypothetical protein